MMKRKPLPVASLQTASGNFRFFVSGDAENLKFQPFILIISPINLTYCQRQSGVSFERLAEFENRTLRTAFGKQFLKIFSRRDDFSFSFRIRKRLCVENIAEESGGALAFAYKLIRKWYPDEESEYRFQPQFVRFDRFSVLKIKADGKGRAERQINYKEVKRIHRTCFGKVYASRRKR